MPDFYVKVPEPTLRRLPWYLAYAKLALQLGETYISSTQIAYKIGIDAAQVAKDFSFVNITGKTRVGYDLKELIEVLSAFLGFSNWHKAFLFGVGSLGSSLLHDNGLRQYGLHVVGAFDVDEHIVGQSINDIPIYNIEKFLAFQKENRVEIGVLTVPVEYAQDVADLMIVGGIKAIWNFTPFRIRVPEEIVVQNTSIYAHLAVMYNRLRETLEQNREL